MDLLQRFVQTARQRPRSLVLPEGQDPRIVAAARRIQDEQIAKPIVLGRADEVAQACQTAGVNLDGIRCVDVKAADNLDAYVTAYLGDRDLDPAVARRMVKRPLFYGGMMVAQGHADTMVAGVATATATVIQAGALTVGYAEGIHTVSSFFLMIVPTFLGQPDRAFVFADCAVNILPTAEQLADIALASAASAARLLDDEPRVAMLSFSTQGSAGHECIDKVTEALSIVKQRRPDLHVDGEFQLDAAVVPSVAAKKCKRPSEVAGRANVLIFPDLNAGNIGYKLTQYLASAQAIGPFLQGFAKPISDLSRGASVDDVLKTAAVVLAMLG